MACWVYRNSTLSLFLLPLLATLPSFAIAAWANNHVRSLNAVMAVWIVLLLLSLGGLSLIFIRRPKQAEDLVIGPNFVSGHSQVQIHLRKLKTAHTLRTLLRFIPGELQRMHPFGVTRVSLDSPLISNDATRDRLIYRFNVAFAETGAAWTAVGHLAGPSRAASFAFVLSYYKLVYLAEKRPDWDWLKARVQKIAPERMNTWKNLRRDAQGRLLWGRIQFVGVK